MISSIVDVKFTVTPMVEEKDGILIAAVETPFQCGPNPLRILVPKTNNSDQALRLLYVLPSWPGYEFKYFDGTKLKSADSLTLIRKLELHEKLGFVVVCPGFHDWPWYADHPTNPEMRQESQMIRVIVPLIDSMFPEASRQRLLLGSSKSGVGAYSLLLRHMDIFSCAAAWDAPLMKDKPDEFGMMTVYGTQWNYENYCFPWLIRRAAEQLRGSKRLGLFGYAIFKDDVEQAHALMQQLGVDHEYANVPYKEHGWDVGWLEGAAIALDKMSRARAGVLE